MCIIREMTIRLISYGLVQLDRAGNFFNHLWWFIFILIQPRWWSLIWTAAGRRKTISSLFPELDIAEDQWKALVEDLSRLSLNEEVKHLCANLTNKVISSLLTHLFQLLFQRLFAIAMVEAGSYGQHYQYILIHRLGHFIRDLFGHVLNTPRLLSAAIGITVLPRLRDFDRVTIFYDMLLDEPLLYCRIHQFLSCLHGLTTTVCVHFLDNVRSESKPLDSMLLLELLKDSDFQMALDTYVIANVLGRKRDILRRLKYFIRDAMRLWQILAGVLKKNAYDDGEILMFLLTLVKKFGYRFLADVSTKEDVWVFEVCDFWKYISWESNSTTREFSNVQLIASLIRLGVVVVIKNGNQPQEKEIMETVHSLLSQMNLGTILDGRDMQVGLMKNRKTNISSLSESSFSESSFHLYLFSLSPFLTKEFLKRGFFS